ncbi:peptidyl-prolyl cis-trans isomerase [Besnoitia besnoiti]|uniref:Peptidyl-prolyl cis-trans isomerase n=1 Tax=Besnoitia besnoiti TaxID=94643 RepID=A0A2A9MEU3_BESBE|nr:peptidyl-prolyl cis-trans isomerase [Besnoitia besnoiti]PFH36389.1 peptidyl-prolyl cis-trans isomerase [Besnoitia besnoiti]
MSEVYVNEPSTRGKVVLHTSLGDLDVELWTRECPKACRNFLQLCLEGYYTNTIFHRVVKDFIIQGGDPTGTGRGGGDTTFDEQPFEVELHPRLKFRYRGLVGVANLGRGASSSSASSFSSEKTKGGKALGTNGNQFFITLGRADVLNNAYTLFGKVTGHTLYNLMKFNELQVGKEDRPESPPVIKGVEVLWNPFEDIVPRRLPALPCDPQAAPGEERETRKRTRGAEVVGSRRAAGSQRKKSDREDEEKEAREKLKKADKKLLSFDENSEGESAGEAAQKKRKTLSAHDLLSDLQLLRESHTGEEEEEEGDADWRLTEKLREGGGAALSSVRARLAALSASSGPRDQLGGSESSDRRARGSEEDASENARESRSASPSSSDDEREGGKDEERGERSQGAAVGETRRIVEGLRRLRGGGADGRGSRAAREEVANSDLMTEAEKRRQMFLIKKRDQGSKQRQETTLQKLDRFTEQLRRLRARGSSGSASSAFDREASVESTFPGAKGGGRGGSRTLAGKAAKAEAGTLNALLPDLDEEIEESDGSWLQSGGLRFAVDSARAYELDQVRAAGSVVVMDPLKGLSDEQKRRRAEERRKQQGRANPDGVRNVPKW